MTNATLDDLILCNFNRQAKQRLRADRPREAAMRRSADRAKRISSPSSLRLGVLERRWVSFGMIAALGALSLGLWLAMALQVLPN